MPAPQPRWNWARLEKITKIILGGLKYAIFGEGGVKKTAQEFKKEFLGEIPIDPQVGKLGDEGTPIVEKLSDHQISKIYIEFAKKIKSLYF